MKCSYSLYDTTPEDGGGGVAETSPLELFGEEFCDHDPNNLVTMLLFTNNFVNSPANDLMNPTLNEDWRNILYWNIWGMANAHIRTSCRESAAAHRVLYYLIYWEYTTTSRNWGENIYNNYKLVLIMYFTHPLRRMKNIHFFFILLYIYVHIFFKKDIHFICIYQRAHTYVLKMNKLKKYVFV